MLRGRSRAGNGEIFKLVNGERFVHDAARVEESAHVALFRNGKHIIFGTKLCATGSTIDVGEIFQQIVHVIEPLVDAVHFKAIYAHFIVERKVGQQP